MSRGLRGGGDLSIGPLGMTLPRKGCGSGRGIQGGGVESQLRAGSNLLTPASRRTVWCGAWAGPARAGPAPPAATASDTFVRPRASQTY